MPIPSSYLDIMRAHPRLQPANFHTERSEWENFFDLADASYISTVGTTSVPPNRAAQDKEVGFFLRHHVEDDQKWVVEGLKGGLEVWQAIVAAFAMTDTRSKAHAWYMFTTCHHDPSLPVGAFIRANIAHADALKGMGVLVTDSMTALNILTRLNSRFNGAKNYCYANFKTLDLEEVKTYLLTCRSDDDNTAPELPAEQTGAQDIKVEPSDSIITHAMRAWPSGARRSGGSSDRRARPGSGFSGSGKSYRWCSAVHNDQCRRCGISGHISDRCVATMPEYIIDWVLTGCPKGPTDEPVSANVVRAMHAVAANPSDDVSDGESDGGVDMSGILDTPPPGLVMSSFESGQASHGGVPHFVI